MTTVHRSACRSAGHGGSDYRVRPWFVPRAALMWVLWLCGEGHTLEPSELFERAQGHVVIVTAFDANQGRIAQANGLSVSALEVVTNCHVVKAARHIEVQHGADKRAAHVRYQDLDRNLCQLALATALPGARPVTAMRRSSALRVGQPVFAIGAPYGADYTLVRGLVAGLRARPGESAKLIQTDVAVSAGLSGSGLFDPEAQLLGLITAGLTDAQNLNIVLPVEWIEELPKRNLERAAPSEEMLTAAPGAAPTVPKAVPPPSTLVDVLPGAKFRYRMSTRGRSLGMVNIEVVGVDGARIRERVTREGYGNYRFDRVANVAARPDGFQPLIVLPGGYQVPEINPYFPKDVPLRVGETWTGVGGEYFIPALGKQRLVTLVRVAGIDRIVVPAGQFEAWRIETLSETIRLTNSPFTVKCVYWYPTSGRRTVKMEVEVLAGENHANSKEVFELMSFEQGR